MALDRFVPDRDAQFTLLAGFMPGAAENVAREYISAYSAGGDLVIDPFAHAPGVMKAALDMGRRVIGVDSNPLAAFVARQEAAPPTARELEDGFKRLAELAKEELTLREQIEGLYATTCGKCGERVIADFFVWDPELGAPVEKEYLCPRDGTRREATNEADRSRAAGFEARGFDYHYVWNRVSDPLGGDLYAPSLRELFELYTARSLHALVTLWLRLESQFKTHPARPALTACFIHALDQGTLLYAEGENWPGRTIPARPIERNVWQLLIQAGQACGGGRPALRLVEKVEQVVETREPLGFLGRGTAQGLKGVPALVGQAALVVTAPPRLEPVFWRLSYFWTRWLWGKREGETLAPFLDPDRHRWSWYAQALASAVRACAELLQPGGRIALLFPAGSDAMVEALCLAGGANGLALEALLFRPHQGSVSASEFGAVRGDYRILFALPVLKDEETAATLIGTNELTARIRAEALAGGREVLAERGEPLIYPWLHHRALARLCERGYLGQLVEARLPRGEQPGQFLRRELNAGLKVGYAGDLDHWRAEGEGVTSVLWYRREGVEGVAPLSQRVAEFVSQLLERSGRISTRALEDAVLDEFAGWLTPEIELVEAAALAAAERVEGIWIARGAEERVLAHAEAVRGTARLGERLGFIPEPGEPPFELVWFDGKIVPGSSSGTVPAREVRELARRFIFVEGMPGWGWLEPPAGKGGGVLVLPESSVALFREFVRRSPVAYARLLEQGWQFLRAGAIEQALGWEELERRHWKALVGLEPAAEKEREQLPLF